MQAEWFVKVTANEIREKKISDGAYLTWVTLQSFFRNGKECWPSIKKLVEIRGKHRETIMRHLKELQEHKYIKKNRRPNTSTKYTLNNDTETAQTPEVVKPVLPPSGSRTLPTSGSRTLPTSHYDMNKKQEKEKGHSSNWDEVIFHLQCYGKFGRRDIDRVVGLGTPQEVQDLYDYSAKRVDQKIASGDYKKSMRRLMILKIMEDENPQHAAEMVDPQRAERKRNDELQTKLHKITERVNAIGIANAYYHHPKITLKISEIQPDALYYTDNSVTSIKDVDLSLIRGGVA